MARISANAKELPASPLEFPVVSPGPKRKRRKSVKGWDGEINIDLDLPTAPDSVMDGWLFFTLFRPVFKLRTSPQIPYLKR